MGPARKRPKDTRLDRVFEQLSTKPTQHSMERQIELNGSELPKIVTILSSEATYWKRDRERERETGLRCMAEAYQCTYIATKVLRNLLQKANVQAWTVVVAKGCRHICSCRFSHDDPAYYCNINMGEGYQSFQPFASKEVTT
ncbi:hypothetical protein O0L34_g17444 [Tuta absoluta]|nr:hypothetical protein O0L34_g17444 [Tuta absoluta]